MEWQKLHGLMQAMFADYAFYGKEAFASRD